MGWEAHVGTADVVRVTGRCVVTGEDVEFEVPKAGFYRYAVANALIQEALPGLEPWQREFLVSSIGPTGWQQTFGGGKEDA